MRLIRWQFLWLLTLGLVGGCAKSLPPEVSVPTGAAPSITLATTTSAQDSGLLDVLLSDFEKQSGIKVKVIAVGSGQALELGRRGDADLLLTHSPEDEKKFVQEGWGLSCRPLMHNDFIIAGPVGDPAGIHSSKKVVDALRRIAEKRCVFISRGDESGTHKKELTLWKACGVHPEGTWYVSSGTGMALSLRMAHEKRGYVMTDRGTYLSHKNEVDLEICFEGDELLLNKYSLMLVNPGRHAHVHHSEAVMFADYLFSPQGQELIRTFGIDQHGEPLFVPETIEIPSPPQGTRNVRFGDNTISVRTER